MPPSFEVFDGSSDAWMPFGFAPAAAQGSARWLRGVARLKPGVTREQAAAEAQNVAREYERAFPDRGKWMLTLRPLDEAFFGGMRQPLLLLQAAVGLVLLIACANLAALILTRAVSRQRELAVRAALGQSRASIVTQLMIESLLLSLAAGVVGAFATWVSLRPLVALTPAWFPRLDAVGIDARVFLFCLGVCVAASVIFGLIPALQASRPNLVRALHESGARTSGSRSRMLQLQGLVVVQVALAFVLLIGAGLVIKTLVRLQGVNLGIETSGLLSLEVQLPRAVYMKDNVGTAPGITLVDYSPAGPLLIDRFHEALQQVPGVVRAAGAMVAPLTGHPGVEFLLEGAPASGKPTFTAYEMVTPDYFATLGTRLVRGRDFNAGDQANTPWVVVVNEAFARTYWPGQEALGKHLTFQFYRKDGELPREVVGVVADTRQFRGETDVQPLVFALHRQQLVRQRASLEVLRMRTSFVHPRERRPDGAGGLGPRRAHAGRSRHPGAAAAHGGLVPERATPEPALHRDALHHLRRGRPRDRRHRHLRRHRARRLGSLPRVRHSPRARRGHGHRARPRGSPFARSSCSSASRWASAPRSR